MSSSVSTTSFPGSLGWRRERVRRSRTRPITTVPDWIAEVLSPSDERRDRVHKAELYLTAGVPFYWIVDVGERTLEAYRSHQGAWVRLGAWTDGDTPPIAPFEAIELDVGSLVPPPARTLSVVRREDHTHVVNEGPLRTRQVGAE